ncbi:hypothetical protein Dimus_002490 [Dionaea muscipula]
MTSSPAVTCPKSSASFSQKCNLLSQYLKEKKRPFADLNLGCLESKGGGSSTNDGTFSRQTSMNLFPQQAAAAFSYHHHRHYYDKPAAAATAAAADPSGQMTILYDSRVVVFNDLPADKAMEIMELARRGCDPAATKSAVGGVNHLTAPPPPAVNNNVIVRSFSFGCDLSRGDRLKACYLPIARQASLHRFFERRKERITARAPYSLTKPEAGSADQSKLTNDLITYSSSWLGLATSSG